VYTSCCPGAMGLETLSVEKAAFSLWSPRALGHGQEKEAYAPYCPGALGLETLLLEKVAFSPCSPRALGLEGFERDEESLMDERFEHTSECLK
jgi:hypothetical protein